MKRLVIIAHSPITDRHIRTIGLDWIAERTEVCYWDVSPIVGNETRLAETNLPSVKVEKIETIDAFRDLSNGLDEHSFVLLFININFKTLPLYKCLSRSKSKIATTITGCLPSVYNAGQAKGKEIMIKLKNLSIKKITELINRLYVKEVMKCLRPIDYCLCAGSEANRLFIVGVNNKTQRIQFNTLDYQITRLASNDRPIEGDYILFIDNYEPFHPDLEIMGLKPVEPTSYFRDLNSYFDLIERKYGIPIVIAPHPKAEKYLMHNYYNGRKIVWNKTNCLVHYSYFVIAHYSTAISYAIIYKKPLLFIYNNDMKNNDPFCSVIDHMAGVLSCACVNVSHSDNVDIKDVDDERYTDYLYKYITSPESMDRNNYKIVLDLLQ